MGVRTVYFNGRFIAESDARLSIYDSALQLGDMAFDVTRTFHQRPFRLRYHLERLWHTLAVLQINPGLSIEELEAVTLETLARNLPTEAAEVDWSITHNISRGPAAEYLDVFPPADRRPTVLVSCFPLLSKMAELAPLYETGIDLVIPAQRSLPANLLDTSIKTRSRVHFQLANLQAAARTPGASAVLVDPDGYLTEGTRANLFLVRNGELLTPELRNVLPGITRGFVFELAARLGIKCHETNLLPADAVAADEVLMTSTSIGVLHARSFDGSQIADGRTGPVAARLREAFTQEVGLDFAVQARQYAAHLERLK
jgi:branched-chain amino acid aminotransferase